MAVADASVLADGSPADRAGHLLCDQYGANWVIAGKLRARKRTRLLPLYDRIVRCAVGRPPSFWLSLHAALREDDAALHHQVLKSREIAGLPDTLSVLRVCDVAACLSCSRSIDLRNAPADLPTASPPNDGL
ncbi:DUF6308 family protein [Streptomyces lancefieldiae]|uniref:DUF6308 family protein n=1 Tax=Streptomyces lancefieldiae TaxID=3075520 RepID=A0ABU3AQM3_9ACTN|nr:DUF6308 family protein [Streptomyces sp. DSM 40712]MDT0612120.1 DUF6308 family protein [Streptomyces sp. DSM 40712]